MMSYTHIMIGISAYLASGLPVEPLPLLVVAVSSILPDADHPKAIINKIILPLRIIPMFVSHRGITHSLVAALVLLVAWFVTDNYLLLCCMVGYVSHIVADMMTVSGVRLFAPFSKRTIRLGRIRTGKDSERVLAMVCVLFICAYILGIRDFETFKQAWFEALEASGCFGMLTYEIAIKKGCI